MSDELSDVHMGLNARSDSTPRQERSMMSIGDGDLSMMSICGAHSGSLMSVSVRQFSDISEPSARVVLRGNSVPMVRYSQNNHLMTRYRHNSIRYQVPSTHIGYRANQSFPSYQSRAPGFTQDNFLTRKVNSMKKVFFQ